MTALFNDKLVISQVDENHLFGSSLEAGDAGAELAVAAAGTCSCSSTCTCTSCTSCSVP
jgi:hypothetical protein